MKRWVCVLSMWCVAGLAQAQQVWKCQVGAEVRYSDRPCERDGKALPAQALQPNLVEAVRLPSNTATATAEAQGGLAAPDRANVCPSDSELRGWETRASSVSYGAEEKQFLQDELRRARQCKKGQGRYNAADWELSRRAQEAQSSLTGAADARQRAEGMHSAADADEGDRIARRRVQRESDQRRAEALAERRQNPAASAQR